MLCRCRDQPRYPAAAASDELICHFVDAVQAPVSINMGFSIRFRPTIQLVAVRRLQEIGVARDSYALMLAAAAIIGMTRTSRCFETASNIVSSPTVRPRPDAGCRHYARVPVHFAAQNYHVNRPLSTST